MLLISALCSGAVCTLASIIIEIHREKKRWKQSLTAELYSYRYQLLPDYKGSTEELSKILNKIPIVFHQDKSVLVARDNLFVASMEVDPIKRGIDMNACLLELIKTTAKASGIECGDWSNDRFVRAFYVNQGK